MAISRLSPLYQNLSEVRCTMYASNFSDLAPSGASWLQPNSAYARFGSDKEDNPKWYPKTQYLTLGPKFFCWRKMTITRRRKHLNQLFRKKSKAQDISHHLTVSNQDLKHFSKSDLLGFAGAVSCIFAPGGRHTRTTKHENKIEIKGLELKNA